MDVIITGYAGFIGYHLTQKLLSDNSINNILAIDNINDYYDISLKKNRIKKLKENKNINKLKVLNIDINEYKKIFTISKKFNIKVIFHLAAQAGIRYSFNNPKAYIDSNINGFFSILELAKNLKIKKLIYASSSSVYGKQQKVPYSEKLQTNEPLQLYAATKISNEAMAYAYSHLYKINSVALRFFTVYGPYGRPDMAIFKFVDRIYKNKKINLYGNGKMLRDFTFIDDITDGIIKVFKNKKNDNKIFHRTYNLGRGKPIKVIKLIKMIEGYLGKKAKISYLERNTSEMFKTHCSINKFKKDYKFYPKISLDEGIRNFIKWYMDYFNHKWLSKLP